MDLNPLTKLLNIPGYKVIEIISITEEQDALLWTFKSKIRYLKCNLNTEDPVFSQLFLQVDEDKKK